MNGSAIVDGAATVLNTVPEVYSDLAKPAACETGKFLGRIPRAINAALAPLDLWITKREYNLEKTKKLIEAELENVDPSKIVSPEAYVAVPALQSIAYSMDSDELRAMYAKLLAKAMNTDYRDLIHPGFVEIIRQMSPLDADNLQIFKGGETLPVAEYRLIHVGTNYNVIQTNVFLENVHVQDIDQQAASLSSLSRLGLISINFTQYVASKDGTPDGARYNRFEETDLYRRLSKKVQSPPEGGFVRPRDDRLISSVKITPGVVFTTPLGKTFIKACL
ncbi:DUF4393 domain-containing protein [Oscillibacter sp.]|uniref:DUF4393 domain-containing protein n=1 Tax=Oscillibacter sp. TaxID=1945593 RepID=UPI00289D1836|nr:DUF4393 domain-containing protein [Oscillibacter sp.]